MEEFAEQNEIPTEDGLGILIKSKKLYHGSAAKSIETFLPAEDTTVGEGLYLTSEKESADGYAQARASGLRNQADTYQRVLARGEPKGMYAAVLSKPEDTPKGDAEARPIVYEASIENLKLLDLREDKNIQHIIEGYRQKLLEVASNSAHYKQSHAIEALHRMGKGLVDKGSLRNITYGLGDIFRDYVVSLGYEGLITFEGGEGVHVGNHDTYVIFDPNKARIIQEQEVEFKNK